jgi:catechol 2,3-dioxygenase-like lactoylglutathione lyase family enzyme
MRVYVTVGAVEPTTAYIFWDAALATIGWSIYLEFPGWRAYSEDGTDNGFLLWVCSPYDGKAASAGNGQMIGFVVDSKSQVDAFYEAAIANGGSDEGRPNPRPESGPNCYAAYVRDPTGNKVAVICNK